ncbi:Hypothetical protein CINCED_3A010556 [Cinara cedri]|uniref:Uncharacterized protein n=1 Tax=Cinara cedri TaxID=506608 RepID=A0A5E4MQA5_9HEMI|nr:Hypothetical protein CINCED_3A010556 [Cinara cedri]
MRRLFTASHTNGQSMDPKCHVCKLTYALYQCPRFLALRTPDKVKATKSANICVNCLQNGHQASACWSAGCQICNKRHNSKLHLEEEKKKEAFAKNLIFQENQTENGVEGQKDGMKDEDTLISLKA